MSEGRRFSSPGEESNADPFGRGCFPLTLLIGLSAALGGWIGWTIWDWPGLAIGVVLVLVAWVHFIWS